VKLPRERDLFTRGEGFALGKVHPPMMMLPFTPSEPMTLHGMCIYPDANLTYRYFALEAVSQVDQKPIVIVQAEAPFRKESALKGPKTKIAQELRDVKAFLKSVNVSQKSYRIKPGPHPNRPPDVVATFGAVEVAIEATQMHIPGSSRHRGLNGVGLAKVFESLVANLAKEGASLRQELHAHRGFMLFLSFGEAEGPASGLPPKANDFRRVPEVVEFLREVQPPLEFLPLGLQPSTRYRDDIRYNSNKTVGVTWHLAERLDPASPVCQALVFELGLMHNREIRQDDAIKEFCRLVKDHDKEDLDYLIVTVGAPTKDGWLYPSDHACASLLHSADDPLGGYEPTHIENIAIHDLTRGGEVRWVFGDASRLSALAKRGRG
jgi:hypothetical protein